MESICICMYIYITIIFILYNEVYSTDFSKGNSEATTCNTATTMDTGPLRWPGQKKSGLCRGLDMGRSTINEGSTIHWAEKVASLQLTGGHLSPHF